jgi:gluconokinase
MIIILMGVSGSGKTTVGLLLARELSWPFYDGDDFHPQVNIEKMKRGVALTDDDRGPWLDTIRQLIDRLIFEAKSAVIACSALKKSYRKLLAEGLKGILFVYLKGDYELIKSRLDSRSIHFFDKGLLKNQFAVLEEPVNALKVDISQEPTGIVNAIKKGLVLSLP